MNPGELLEIFKGCVYLGGGCACSMERTYHEFHRFESNHVVHRRKLVKQCLANETKEQTKLDVNIIMV